MIRAALLKACIATTLLSVPSSLVAQYSVDVVDIFDRACIPYSVEDRHPAESGLRKLTTGERVSTIFEGEVYDNLVWVDPAVDFVAFFVIPDEGCGVSGWVSEPDAVVEEVAMLADRLGAVSTKYEWQQVSLIQEQGYGSGRFCVDVESKSQAVLIHARIGRENDRWGATLSTSETQTCETNQAGGN